MLGRDAYESTESRESSDLGLEHIIDLFLQCKHLYSIYGEVKKTLMLILRQEEIFNKDSGVIQMIMKKQSQIEDQGSKLTEKDEHVIIKSLLVLQKLSRKLQLNLSDQRMRHQFIFKGIDYQDHLYEKAILLLHFLKNYSNNPDKDQYKVNRDHNRCLKLTLPNNVNARPKATPRIANKMSAETINYENVKESRESLEQNIVHKPPIKKPDIRPEEQQEILSITDRISQNWAMKN